MADDVQVFVLASDSQRQNRLTWFHLELICELLRKHKRIEIRCEEDQGPYMSDLVTELTAVKGKS